MEAPRGHANAGCSGSEQAARLRLGLDLHGHSRGDVWDQVDLDIVAPDTADGLLEHDGAAIDGLPRLLLDLRGEVLRGDASEQLPLAAGAVHEPDRDGAQSIREGLRLLAGLRRPLLVRAPE